MTEQDMVLTTRIRLARNFTSYPFPAKMSPDQKRALGTAVAQAVENANFGANRLKVISLESLKEWELFALIEKHLISPEFAEHPVGKTLICSEDHTISIMVCEEDHLRIQIILSGLQLQKAYELADKIDDLFESAIGYAFDPELGYLTACPTNLGTGLRASVMLHLPALEGQGALAGLSATISKLGLTIRGTYGEGSEVTGSVYQLSNQITLGISEQHAIQNLEGVVRQLMRQEEDMRKMLYSDHPQQIEDRVWRSYGVLQNARILSGKECDRCLSDLRLGLSLGILPTVTPDTLRTLADQTGAASICVAAGSLLQPEERDNRRAALCREILSK